MEQCTMNSLPVCKLATRQKNQFDDLITALPITLSCDTVLLFQRHIKTPPFHWYKLGKFNNAIDGHVNHGMVYISQSLVMSELVNLASVL